MKSRKMTALVLTLAALVLMAAGIAFAAAAAEFDGAWNQAGITMATSTAGGTQEMVGAAATELMSRAISSTKFSSIPTSGGVTNIPLMDNGECEVAFTTGAIVSAALAGTDPYKQSYGNIASLCALYANTLQIWVQADSDIHDFSDLKDKKFTFGQPGVGAFQLTLDMMKLCGFSEEEVKAAGGQIQYLSWGDSVAAMQDGNIDALIYVTSYPAGLIVDASLNRDFRLLQVDPEVLNKFMAQYEGYVPVTIPAGTYHFQKEDVTTIGTPNILVCKADLDADLVYEMTKAIWEGRGTLANTYALLSEMSLENVAKGMVADIHPGAKKYYEEIGAALD